MKLILNYYVTGIIYFLKLNYFIMKKVSKFLNGYKAFVAFMMLTLLQGMAFAQDSGNASSSSSSSTTTTTTTETWYTEPWVWIVGGAVLILLIVALTRSGGGGNSTGSSASRTDKVTVTKTSSTD